MLTTTDSSTKLVKLRKSKPITIFNHHRSRVGYVDANLDAVEAISQGRDGWGDRSTQNRQHVQSNLFPRPLADQAFLDRLDAFMAERELVDSVRRLVIERRDDAARALGNRVR